MENKMTLIGSMIQCACTFTEDCKTDEEIHQRLERRGQADEAPTMKIYIARDAATFEDEDQERFVGRHPEKETEFGRLRLFYEKPELNNRTGEWEGARTAGELKRYMFPEIRCKECMEFTGPSNIPEHLHYPGALHETH